MCARVCVPVCACLGEWLGRCGWFGTCAGALSRFPSLLSWRCTADSKESAAKMYDTVLGKLPVSVRSRAGPGPDRPSAAAARRGAARRGGREIWTGGVARVVRPCGVAMCRACVQWTRGTAGRHAMQAQASEVADPIAVSVVRRTSVLNQTPRKGSMCAQTCALAPSHMCTGTGLAPPASPVRCVRAYVSSCPRVTLCVRVCICVCSPA